MSKAFISQLSPGITAFILIFASGNVQSGPILTPSWMAELSHCDSVLAGPMDSVQRQLETEMKSVARTLEQKEVFWLGSVPGIYEWRRPSNPQTENRAALAQLNAGFHGASNISEDELLKLFDELPTIRTLRFTGLEQYFFAQTWIHRLPAGGDSGEITTVIQFPLKLNEIEFAHLQNLAAILSRSHFAQSKVVSIQEGQNQQLKSGQIRYVLLKTNGISFEDDLLTHVAYVLRIATAMREDERAKKTFLSAQEQGKGVLPGNPYSWRHLGFGSIEFRHNEKTSLVTRKEAFDFFKASRTWGHGSVQPRSSTSKTPGGIKLYL